MADYYIASNKYSIKERKLQDGKTVYDIQFRIQDTTGKIHNKMIRGFINKTKAKEGYLDFVKDNCEFLPSYKKIDIKKADVIFNDAFFKYLWSLKETNQNKESTIYDKNKIFELFVLPYFKNNILPIQRKDLEEWQNNLLKENHSYKYVCKVRAYFSSFLTWCETEYEIPNNFRYVKRPVKRASNHIIKFWSKEEFTHFISGVDDDMYKTIFILMFYTGRRKGEILSLNKKDINLNKRTITWCRSVTYKFARSSNANTYLITSTKRDKIQTLPIADIVYDTLVQYFDNHELNGEFIFGGNRPLAENTLRRKFNYYCDLAELEQIRIHDLRHSFASMLLHNGTNYQTIATLIGDTTQQVIQTYCHIANSEIDNAILKL